MLQRMDDRVKKFIATGARVIMLLEPPSVHAGSQTEPNSNDIEYEEMNALLKRGCGAASETGRRREPSGPGLPFRTAVPVRCGRLRLDHSDGGPVDPAGHDSLSPDPHRSGSQSGWCRGLRSAANKLS